MYKLQFKDNPEKSIWLVGDKVTLGKAKSNTLVLDSLGIDDFHASIEINHNRLILKSKGGTCSVNDLPVDSEHELLANDELRIGKDRMLIIDPKERLSEPSIQNSDDADGGAEAQWQLLPEHKQLSDRDFSIVGTMVLGRAKDCDFSIPYKMLSREHVQFWTQDGDLYLKDLGSSNGCFVNGERVDEAQLHHGDKISFAKLGFTINKLGEEGSVSSEPQEETKEELNKTIIRPAINLESVGDLESLVLEEASDNSDISLENAENNTKSSPENSAKSGGSKAAIALGVGAVILFLTYWLVTQN